MLVAGDERWRTQRGNNNAYGQDNEISWIDWSQSPESQDVLALAQRLLALRRRHPVLRQPAFFEGRAVPGGDGCKDLAWFHPDGREMSQRDWYDAGLRTIGMYFDGRGLRHRGRRGEMIVDDSFLLVLHSGEDDVTFALPGAPWASSYEMVVDTRCVGGAPHPRSHLAPGGSALPVTARSALVLLVNRG
jgi:isoamylase